MELHRIDAADAYINGAFDEDGDEVLCDRCDGELRFRDGEWICLECLESMCRKEYFNYMGAEPPNKCLDCDQNYPVCRNWCYKDTNPM